MARRKRQTIPTDDACGLWACPELAEREDSAEAGGAGQSGGQAQRSLSSVQIRRFSNLQKILIVCIVFIAVTFIYAMLRVPSGPVTAQPRPAAGALTDGVRQKNLSEAERLEAVEAPKESLSLAVAEASYRQKDYQRAYAAYNQLSQALAADEQDDPLKDFLQLKMAFCMEKAGNTQQANSLFKALLQSSLPAIRALAAYHQIFAELESKQYWQARTRAYQAIALVETIDFNRDWALTLERECNFLVAEALTRNVLSLCDADKDLPPQLWHHSFEADPFINLSEAQLRSVLNGGCDQLRRALLGPQIQQLQSQGAPASRGWSVICCGAPIEELLARFAAHAKLDIRWVCDSADGGPGQQKLIDTVRNRPVYLYLSAATPQQVVSVAAGCVGLIAQLDDPARIAVTPEVSCLAEDTTLAPGQLVRDREAGSGQGIVRILNPSGYSSLSEQLAMLHQEAVSLWQRFLLTSVGSDRIVNAHFALGLLAAQKGQLPDALAQFKLVANRFSQTPFASYSLLHASRLKVKLCDYTGAREDLKQLIELYPDSKFSDQAYFSLADATMKAGLFDEGARLFCKAYNLGFSPQSKIASALGAGRCFYQQKDYTAAAEWLSRFVSLAKDGGSRRAGSLTSADFNSACFLLGKTYLALGKHEQAGDALEYALGWRAARSLAGPGLSLPTGQLPRQEYIEAVSALVDTRTQQGHFIEALDALEMVVPWQFSQKESVEMLLLRAKVLRCMGLSDKAILVLADRAEYLLDTQLKAKVLYELAKCQIAEQDLELARRSLTEVLVLVEPGAFAQQVGCELAEVCLRLSQTPQVVSICSQILDSAPPGLIKQRALDILAKAYVGQKNYEGAVSALLGIQ